VYVTRVVPQNVANSIRYLGWSLHMVGDLTVPYHANNEATSDHRDWEREADKALHSFNPHKFTMVRLKVNITRSPRQFMQDILESEVSDVNAYKGINRSLYVAVSRTASTIHCICNLLN
jgi:hypothetical protein